jgi:hypothetical protein
MTGDAVQAARADVERLEAQLEDARARLERELLEAQQAGATVAQLQEWAGLSRRRVFDLLKRARQ